MTTAVVICPGRGTYGQAELRYLARHFRDAPLLGAFDAIRETAGQDSITELDTAQRYSTTRHTRGDNASALIFAAGLGDFAAIDQDKVEIVAVTGNSMGWYTALACAGALTPTDGFTVANTMGTLMQQALIGGQLIYPVTCEDWRPDPKRKADLLAQVAEIGARPGHTLALSIDLGGMLVLAGDDAGLEAFTASVPRLQGRFPMRLANHAAFHTSLQAPVAERGRARLAPDLFGQPDLPLIDGRGAIWWPGACDTHAMWDYTLGHQVTEAYNFNHALTVASREFAPDLFILVGPGDTLGGAVAQSLIAAGWRGMADKKGFVDRQGDTPVLVSMGRTDQRGAVA